MANSSSYEDYDYAYLAEEFVLTSDLKLLVLLSVLSVVLDAFIVLANITIIVALVKTNRRDRARGQLNISKVLMTSLAVTDAAVGLTVVPLFSYELIYNGFFYLGPEWCMVRSVLDSFLCTASIYHVVAMALDRYLAVCQPLSYRKLSAKVGYVMVAVSWILPFVTLSIPMIIWTYALTEVEKNGQVQSNMICFPVFDKDFSNESTVTSFLLPFLIIFILYFLILREIRQYLSRRPQSGAQTIPQQQHKHPHSSTLSSTSSHGTAVKKFSHEGPEMPISHTSDKMISSISSPTTSDSHVPNTSSDFNPTNISDSQHGHSSIHFDTIDASNRRSEQKKSNSLENIGGANAAPKTSNASRQKQSGPGNVKAVRTLGSIVIVFAICWIPYSVLLFIETNTNTIVSAQLFTFLVWLGYINSALNPFLYCGHKSIKAAIRDLLCPPGPICC